MSLSPVLSSSTSTQAGAALPNTDADVRKRYNAAITDKYENKYKAKAAEFHKKEQCFGPALAREACEERHAIKLAHQGDTSLLGKIGIIAHNLLNYGTIESPGCDYLVNQQKSPEEVFYSAFKTGGADLGLENNGFAETLQIYSALKDKNIYPEDIDSKTLACFKSNANGKLTKEAILASYDCCVATGNTSFTVTAKA